MFDIVENVLAKYVMSSSLPIKHCSNVEIEISR